MRRRRLRMFSFPLYQLPRGAAESMFTSKQTKFANPGLTVYIDFILNIVRKQNLSRTLLCDTSYNPLHSSITKTGSHTEEGY
jgi:hypothetical protein